MFALFVCFGEDKNNVNTECAYVAQLSSDR